MSAADGVDARPPAATSWPLRMRANAAATLVTLLRAPRPGAPRLAWPSGLGLLLDAAIVIAIILATMALIDGRAIEVAGRLPGWLLLAFDEITDFGKSVWFLVPLAVALAAVAVVSALPLPRLARLTLAAIAVRLGFLFLAIGLPGLVVTVLKRLIGRARPLVTGDGYVFAFKPFAWQVDYASLPSGHATTAFAAAMAVGAIWTSARPAMWTYALLIGVSRVVLTAHYPSDVVAGAAFGIVGVILVRGWFARRRLGFVVGGDGTVSPLSGPSWRRIKAVARRLLSA